MARSKARRSATAALGPSSPSPAPAPPPETGPSSAPPCAAGLCAKALATTSSSAATCRRTWCSGSLPTRGDWRRTAATAPSSVAGSARIFSIRVRTTGLPADSPTRRASFEAAAPRASAALDDHSEKNSGTTGRTWRQSGPVRAGTRHVAAAARGARTARTPRFVRVGGRSAAFTDRAGAVPRRAGLTPPAEAPELHLAPGGASSPARGRSARRAGEPGEGGAGDLREPAALREVAHRDAGDFLAGGVADHGDRVARAQRNEAVVAVHAGGGPVRDAAGRVGDGGLGGQRRDVHDLRVVVDGADVAQLGSVAGQRDAVVRGVLRVAVRALRRRVGAERLIDRGDGGAGVQVVLDEAVEVGQVGVHRGAV